MAARDVHTISVLGAGTMGHGIAQVAALAGYDVTLRDISDEFVQRGYDQIEKSLGKSVDRGNLTASAADDALARIEPVVEMERALSNADFVIEAVPERMGLKQTVYQEVATYLPPRAILATNTSSLSITALAAASDRPTQFIGLHFFNPPVVMRLVEVISGDQTSDETVERAMALVESMDKVPILVRKDTPGFIVNRILLPVLNEAAWLVENGEATREEVDSSAKFGLELPMGLFELLDYVGIDVVLDVLTYMRSELGPAYEPCPVFAQMVDDGTLGKKSGAGFYDYGRPVDVPSDAVDSDLQIRFVAVMANEVGKLLADDVAPVADIDRAMELGAGFPEGPAVMADEYGLPRLVQTLKRHHARTDSPRYEPSPYLVSLVDNGTSLRSAD